MEHAVGAHATSDLALELRPRHTRMLAIGGTIGVGLFLGSGAGIAAAGPSILIAYCLVGAVIWVSMRALGELLMYRPAASGFVDYAREFLGPAYGFVTGWGYWITWTLLGMTELTAVGVCAHIWLPFLPQWAIVAVALVLLVLLNLAKVGLFGEVDFWLSAVKVLAIVAFILAGAAFVLLRYSETGRWISASVPSQPAGESFFPSGFDGFGVGVVVAVFSFQGSELVAVAANETRNRSRVIPAAIAAVPLRLGLFYIGSMLVLILVMPWSAYSASESPFVKAAQFMHVPAAAILINAVVISSALSSCSSGALYSNARLLLQMSNEGIAPQVLGGLNRRQVPAAGVLASAGALGVGVALNAAVPAEAFAYLLSICSFFALWTLASIALSLIGYRLKLRSGAVPPSTLSLKGGPTFAVLILVFTAAVLFLMSLKADTRVALVVGPSFILVLAVIYALKRTRGTNRLSQPAQDYER